MNKYLLFNNDGYEFHGLYEGKKYKIVKETERAYHFLNEDGQIRKAGIDYVKNTDKITLIEKKGNLNIF